MDLGDVCVSSRWFVEAWPLTSSWFRELKPTWGAENIECAFAIDLKPVGA